VELSFESRHLGAESGDLRGVVGVLAIVVSVWLFSYGFIAVVAAFVLRSEGKRTAEALLGGAVRPAT